MHVAIIGSGAAGVAAATALLEAGHRVEMLDVGLQPEPWSLDLAARIRARTEAGGRFDREVLRELKRGRDEPPRRGLRSGLATMLGKKLGPELSVKRILGSGFVFSGVEESIPLENAIIPRSVSTGGLSNVWGASCYPLRSEPEEYAPWPFSPEEIIPYYARAAELLGIVQGEDDLARAYPIHGPRGAVAPRNPGSPAERLLARWSAHQPALARLGFAGGRTRLAVRSEGIEGDACRRCGLCVYGCAFDSIYSASRTLAALSGRKNFTYQPGWLVLDFAEHDAGVTIRARRVNSEAIEQRSYDALFLAAGTLSTLRIVADSLRAYDRPTPIFDNDLHLLPVVLWHNRVSSRFRSAFTLGEAVLAVEPGVVAPRGVHVQFYSFHEYFLAELSSVFAALPWITQRATWGILNNILIAFVYLAGPDSVIATARVLPGAGGRGGIGRIHIDAQEKPESRRILKKLCGHLWRARAELGFAPLYPLHKSTPFGFSGHLAGSLPMRRTPGPLETDPDGLVFGTRRVRVVDAAAFVTLPAQNPTFTIMANAMRVADAFSATGAG